MLFVSRNEGLPLDDQLNMNSYRRAGRRELSVSCYMQAIALMDGIACNYHIQADDMSIFLFHSIFIQTSLLIIQVKANLISSYVTLIGSH